jgi:hypothetical protein
MGFLSEGRLLDLPSNIRLGWKSQTATNTLVYSAKELIIIVKLFYDAKMFIIVIKYVAQ